MEYTGMSEESLNRTFMELKLNNFIHIGEGIMVLIAPLWN